MLKRTCGFRHVNVFQVFPPVREPPAKSDDGDTGSEPSCDSPFQRDWWSGRAGFASVQVLLLSMIHQAHGRGGTKSPVPHVFALLASHEAGFSFLLKLETWCNASKQPLCPTVIHLGCFLTERFGCTTLCCTPPCHGFNIFQLRQLPQHEEPG